LQGVVSVTIRAAPVSRLTQAWIVAGLPAAVPLDTFRVRTMNPTTMPTIMIRATRLVIGQFTSTKRGDCWAVVSTVKH
jgi:hypothetical protein